MRVPDIIQTIHLPQDSIFHRGGTALYLVGNKHLVLIDTGNLDQEGSRSVLEHLSAHPERGPLRYILLTHSHRDHVGGLAAIYGRLASARGGLAPEVYAHPLAVDRLREEWDFPYAQPLNDEQSIVVDDITLTTLYTPGHCQDHLCFFEPQSAMLFSGDLVLGTGSASIDDLTAALASLRRLLALRPRLLCPGHGPLVEDGTRRLRTYIAHRFLRERQILQQLSHGPKTSAELLAAVYPRLDDRLRRAAERNVFAHLEKLVREERVSVTGSSTPRFALIHSDHGARPR